VKREDLVLEESTRVALITMVAGEESPWHHHSSVTEHVVCVSGKITLKMVSTPASVILAPGEWHEIPPDVRHCLFNSEELASTYILVQRGAYDFVSSNS